MMIVIKRGLDIKRSKKAIYSSFLILIRRHDFSEISVQDIIDDCGYSRACFYHTFEDKHNMPVIFVQDEAKAYIDYFITGFLSAKSLGNKEDIYLKAGISAFEFIYSEKDFYEALILGRIPGQNKDSFFKFANDYFIEKASYPIEKKYSDININLYISSMTAIMGSFIEFWVKENFEHSPEYMEEQLMLFLNTVGKTDFVEA